MFFSNKKPSDRIRIASRQFCIEFCALAIPYLHKGLSLHESWQKIKWLMIKERETDIFEEMVEKKFSNDQIELFSYRYNDQSYGGLNALFLLLHHFHDKPSDMIASVLTLFHIKLQPVPYMTDSMSYTSKQLYDYANGVIDQIN